MYKNQFAVGAGLVAAWVILTVVTVIGYNEYRAHGEQHAFVKVLMQERAQAVQDHEALKSIITFLNQQVQASQQKAQGPPPPR